MLTFVEYFGFISAEIMTFMIKIQGQIQTGDLALMSHGTQISILLF